MGAGLSDPKLYDYYFKPWAAPDGRRGFTIAPFPCDNPPFVKDGVVKFWFGTLKISDPQWRGQAADKALLLDYYAPLAPAEVTVRLGDYSVTRPLDPAGQGWGVLRLERTDLKDKDGKSPPSWQDIVAFTLTGTASVDKLPVFRNLRWDR